MTRNKVLYLFIFVFFTVFSSLIYSEEVVDPDFGYSLDLPEGFSIAEYTPDGMSYRFSHDELPVSLVLKLYDAGKYNDCEEALKGSLDKLKSKYDMDTISWCNVPCSIASVEMNLNNVGKSYTGWAVSSTLVKSASFLVLICYCDSEVSSKCSQFIVSTLNSLVIDEDIPSPGIITSFAYPLCGKKQLSFNIGGKNIVSSFDKVDVDAEKFLIDCEWSVLSLYAGKSKWKEAWIRYYRMIYRDAEYRLKSFITDSYVALKSSAEKKNKENPYVALNEIFLEWVQNFEYKRDVSSAGSSDFTGLVSVLSGNGNDCDSRSMLMSILMNGFGIDSCMFVSNEYSHAVYGSVLDVAGAKIQVGEEWYLLGETTAKGIKPGLISQDMSDTEKWIPVEFK